MTLAERWKRANNLLCVRLDALGDLVMTTPALRALKEAVPARQLILLTSRLGEKAAPLLPMIDEVMVYDAPWMKATAPRAEAALGRSLIERLRARRLDAAVIFTVYSQNPLPAALLCQLADIPLRIAYCRENPYQLLSDWLPEPDRPEAMRHEVRRALDLAAATGARAMDERLSVCIPPRARPRAAALLDDLALRRDRPWALVHPGASAPSRRYPPEGFAAVARELTHTYGWQIIFTGSPAEQALVTEIRAAMGAPSYSLAGRLDLPELAALIAAAPLLITNNTAPAHLAAAVQTPVVDLYALTNPQHTPWGVPHRVVYHDVDCKYCYKSVCPQGHHACLRGVAPASVVAAALALYEQTHPPLAAQG
jgi:lipopolysaccharide heptosyltransferase II